MTDDPKRMSRAFEVFRTDAPEFAQVWGGAVQGLAKASALDAKTRELAHLAVLAALGRTSGVPFHVASLKEKGATRDEIISAVLVGLPVAGHVVTQSLAAAVDAFDGN